MKQCTKADKIELTFFSLVNWTVKWGFHNITYQASLEIKSRKKTRIYLTTMNNYITVTTFLALALEAIERVRNQCTWNACALACRLPHPRPPEYLPHSHDFEMELWMEPVFLYRSQRIQVKVLCKQQTVIMNTQARVTTILCKIAQWLKACFLASDCLCSWC